MYYGHGSWIAVVIFGGVMLVRILSSQRRGGRGREHPGPGSAFSPGPVKPAGGGRDSGPPMEPPVGGTATATGSGTAPGWFADPFFKHRFRYWSGSTWTEHVSDNGVPGVDPPPERPGRAGPD